MDTPPDCDPILASHQLVALLESIGAALEGSRGEPHSADRAASLAGIGAELAARLAGTLERAEFCPECGCRPPAPCRRP